LGQKKLFWEKYAKASFINFLLIAIGVLVLPIFMGSKRINEKISDIFFWIFLVAIFLRLGLALFKYTTQASIFGVIEGAALVAFSFLNYIFSRPQVDLSKTGADLSYVKLIKGAYFWLTVGGLFLMAFSILEALGTKLIVGDKSYDAEEGEIAVCGSMERHGFTATTDMVLLAVIAPRP